MIKTKTNISAKTNVGSRRKVDIITGESGPYVSGDILDANAVVDLIQNSNSNADEDNETVTQSATNDFIVCEYRDESASDVFATAPFGTDLEECPLVATYVGGAYVYQTKLHNLLFRLNSGEEGCWERWAQDLPFQDAEYINNNKTATYDLGGMDTSGMYDETFTISCMKDGIIYTFPIYVASIGG